MFRPGDKVTCYRKIPTFAYQAMVGHVYTVRSIHPSGEYFDTKERKGWFSFSYFKIVKDHRVSYNPWNKPKE